MYIFKAQSYFNNRAFENDIGHFTELQDDDSVNFQVLASNQKVFSVKYTPYHLTTVKKIALATPHRESMTELRCKYSIVPHSSLHIFPHP